MSDKPMLFCERRADAECYVVRAHHEWGYFFIHEPSGSFSAITSFGNFAYIRSSIGTRTLKEFLLNLEYHYFFTKTDTLRHGRAWDKDASVRDIKHTITERWRQGGFTKDEARDAFDEINIIAAEMIEGPGGENVFCQRVYENDVLYNALRGDLEGIVSKKDDPQCVGFWEKLWPVFLEGIRPAAIPSDPLPASGRPSTKEM